uniref:tRNA (32-2'-O)-methyltransferase regulator THADA n=1 Tax=Callorhinchus milii TaxID=7868 RepID=A0A4W3HEY4_CALMI
MHDSLVALKASMVLVQKVQEKIHGCFCGTAEPPLWEVMCGLLTCFIEILVDGDFLQAVQSTAGMAAVLFIKTIVHQDEALPKLVSELLFPSKLLVVPDVPEWLIESCGELCRTAPSDASVLFLCQGTLAMLDWRSGRMKQSGEQLLLEMLTPLFTLHLKESSMAMSISRILTLWTCGALEALDSHSCSQHLKNSLSGSSEAVQKLLEYVWTHWEHPLDGVRHQTKALFKNVLKIHQKAAGCCGMTDPFFVRMTRTLLDLEWHVKGKYASLSCLVEYLGTQHILDVDDSIPKQVLGVMREQSLANYASDLLEKMFVSHKKQLSSTQPSAWIDQWHETWVSPFLAALCEEEPGHTTYIIDYYLPKLLKCSPESLTHMIKELRSSSQSRTIGKYSRGALGALMTCLRAARARGLWNGDAKWDQLVPVNLVKQALVHKHEQVRVDALGLICETHRSTQTLSSQEMALIKFFLPYNLNSQSPGTRQQIVWLMKKLFCRLRDSSQVLHKQTQNKVGQKRAPRENTSTDHDPVVQLQQYKHFMFWTCDLLFQALFPGTSYPSKFTVLSLLGIIAEVIECSEVLEMTDVLQPTYTDALLACLTSTFEELKMLAYDLLKRFPASVLGLKDTEKLQTLLQAALDLMISTKPYDCITASYLLALLTRQEGLQAALHASTITNCLSGLTSINLYLIFSPILVIKVLLNILSTEIEQAERSLVQAAASNPLYGRVHCIIGALQQLSLKSLIKVSEWRETVTELIKVAFRLSAVVSPVVQSSSPEGLIPMDTDSESAANLHVILNEIKPRDNNDYFAQAKLLKNERDEESGEIPPEDCKPAEGKFLFNSVTAQMVLVCCWRSMKEISLLLGLLCQNLPLQSSSDSEDGLLTVPQIEDIGVYFKRQLLQSRHRGAFELAYVGFVKLTEMLTSCNNRSLQKLPQCWLEDVLQEIKSSDPASKLCATRRSAGIPFYIQALVSSEPKGSNLGLLKMTMKELMPLALPSEMCQDDASTIPQVHALNVLRALFRDTRLSESVIPYVADGTQAAILGFTSPVWAVRNSSTLLFSTLITRIFGVKKGKDEHSKKNRMTGREFFARFPTLYPFLLKQLETVANTVDSEAGVLKLHPSLFLLLLVLGRLFPSPMDGTSSALSLAPFVPFIIRCSHSAVLRSREMAARALVPFVTVDQVLPTVRSLMEALPGLTEACVRQNHVHGTLLQALHLLHSYFETKQRTDSTPGQELHDIIGCTRAKVWLATRQNPCLLTRATFLDIIGILCHHLGKLKTEDPETLYLWQDSCHIVLESELVKAGQQFSPVPGLIQWQRSITRLSLLVTSSRPQRVTPQDGSCQPARGILQPGQLLCHLLQSEFHEVRLVTLETLMLWLEEWDENVLFLLSEAEDTLKKLAMQETRSECLAKVRDYLIIAGNRISENCSMAYIGFLMYNVFQTHKSLDSESHDFRQWVHLVAQSCGAEQQTDIRLTAANVLIDAVPLLLASKQLYLGLLDTLSLWKCVFTLLQDEEQVVRDTAADQCSTNTYVLLSVVNPSLALDLGFGVLCELLQIWRQTYPGVLAIIKWMLEEDEYNQNLGEDDFLFEKSEINLWAEKITFLNLIWKHLSTLLSGAQVPVGNESELRSLVTLAEDQAQRVGFLGRSLGPAPEFSQTADCTRFNIQKIRLSKVTQLLSLVGLDAAIPAHF